MRIHASRSSIAMFGMGLLMLVGGAFALGSAPAEAASPATVTINYLSDGRCGSVAGTTSASVSMTSGSMGLTNSSIRGCTATFRVVR